MKKHFTLKIIAVLTCATVLVACILVVSRKNEWWFPRLQLLLKDNTPDIKAADASVFTIEYTLDKLKNDSRTNLCSFMMLVNSEHPIPSDFEPDVVEYNSALMSPEMVDAYVKMRDETEARTSVHIYVSSHFRTKEDQARILAESDTAVAAQVGCSEHETGMALDIYAKSFGGTAFLDSPAGRYINRHCGEYGFIIRYPYGKTDITGITYEPWHIRYVGQPHSRLIMDSGLSYEEYIDFLTPEKWFKTDGNCYILRTAAQAVRMPESWSKCSISPDNTGYFIITVFEASADPQNA